MKSLAAHFRSPLLLALLACSMVTDTAAQNAKPAPLVSPTIHRGDGWAIAAPASWTVDRVIRPPTTLKLRGEGAKGFPRVDATLQPLKIGVRVDRYGDKVGRIDVVADSWRRGIQAEDDWRVLGKMSQRKVQLTGGVDAFELAVQKASTDGTRIAYYYAIVAAGEDRRAVVVTGSVHFGRAARLFIKKVGLFALVKAHVASVTVDGKEVDAKKLAPVYDSYQWRAAEGIERTLVANRLLRQRELVRASTMYRKALATCGDVSAAHQKLAWLHLSTRDPKLLDAEFGLKHALIAVQQTGWLDLPSLDTLALAYIKNRKSKQAAEVFRKAMQKDPDNESLRQRLDLYE